VARVDALDETRHVGRPVGDDAVRAALAAGLVHELPRKYGRAVAIASHHGGDEGLVYLLGLGNLVPAVVVVVWVVDVPVHVDAAPVTPVVGKGHDELEAETLAGRDDVIEARDAVVAIVEIATGSIEVLVPNARWVDGRFC